MVAVPDMTVFRGWPERGKYVWSPFAIKLEARLRFSGVKYATDAGSLAKGKIPYIECTSPTNPGTTVQLRDSALIIKQLTEWGMIPDLNAQVPAALSAHDLALRSLLEDKLYFYHVSAPSDIASNASRGCIRSVVLTPKRCTRDGC